MDEPAELERDVAAVFEEGRAVRPHACCGLRAGFEKGVDDLRKGRHAASSGGSAQREIRRGALTRTQLAAKAR